MPMSQLPLNVPEHEDDNQFIMLLEKEEAKTLTNSIQYLMLND